MSWYCGLAGDFSRNKKGHGAKDEYKSRVNIVWKVKLCRLYEYDGQQSITTLLEYEERCQTANSRQVNSRKFHRHEAAFLEHHSPAEYDEGKNKKT